MGPVTLNKDNLVNKAGIQVDVIPIRRSPTPTPSPKPRRKGVPQIRARSDMGFYHDRDIPPSPLPKRRLEKNLRPQSASGYYPEQRDSLRAKSATGYYPEQLFQDTLRPKSATGFYGKEKSLSPRRSARFYLEEFQDTYSLPDLERVESSKFVKFEIKKGQIMTAVMKFNEELLLSRSMGSSSSLSSRESKRSGSLVNVVKDWMAKSSPFGSAENVKTETNSLADTNIFDDDLTDSISLSDSVPRELPDIYVFDENVPLIFLFDDNDSSQREDLKNNITKGSQEGN